MLVRCTIRRRRYGVRTVFFPKKKCILGAGSVGESVDTGPQKILGDYPH